MRLARPQWTSPVVVAAPQCSEGNVIVENFVVIAQAPKSLLELANIR